MPIAFVFSLKFVNPEKNPDDIFWQAGGNRLSRQGDTAKVVLAAPACRGCFQHGRLRHLHGPSDGAGTEHVSDVVRA
jgi:hypothetical protein